MLSIVFLIGENPDSFSKACFLQHSNEKKKYEFLLYMTYSPHFTCEMKSALKEIQCQITYSTYIKKHVPNAWPWPNYLCHVSSSLEVLFVGELACGSCATYLNVMLFFPCICFLFDYLSC